MKGLIETTTKIPFGLRDGSLIHISEVESGIKCKCICPSCKQVLVAKKGSKTVHHFSHHSLVECKGAYETALHLAAKEILIMQKKIRLPKVEIEFNSYRKNFMISEETFFEFDEVKAEFRMNNIIPDIFVVIRGKPLLIEVTVTHKTDSDKIKKIKEKNISCLEIDLSKIGLEFTLEELEDLIIDKVDNKKWLYNVRATKIKEDAFDKADKKLIILRGFASHVDNCPLKSRYYRGTYYANVMQDCLYCDRCLYLDPHEVVLCSPTFENI